MESEKTPGTDGLPAEFYKVFWKDISSILISALNFAYESGQLSITQKRGIIKLIPKKDADPSLIKNWRPLTLLNCDYKIAAKSTANRLKSVIPNLINNDQTGFIKGRFIGENIRLLESVICFAKENNIPGLILFLDFEKAFDTLEWTFIRKTLEHFGFGKGIISWLNLFHAGPAEGTKLHARKNFCVFYPIELKLCTMIELFIPNNRIVFVFFILTVFGGEMTSQC